jgi:hypothetical protein
MQEESNETNADPTTVALGGPQAPAVLTESSGDACTNTQLSGTRRIPPP